MPRGRQIKPGFFMDGDLLECDPLARILFAGLWCWADRKGRLEDKPKDIKVQILPADNVDVDELLNQLSPHFITRYEVNGKHYIQINNFDQHQNPHKNEAESGIPSPGEKCSTDAGLMQEPEEHSTRTVQASEENTTNPACVLEPSTLYPCSSDASAREEHHHDHSQQEELPEELCDPEFAATIHFYRDNFNRGKEVTPFVAQNLSSWAEALSSPVLLEAMKQSAGESRDGSPSLKYLEAKLKDWLNLGIVGPEEAKAKARGRPKEVPKVNKPPVYRSERRRNEPDTSP